MFVKQFSEFSFEISLVSILPTVNSRLFAQIFNVQGIISQQGIAIKIAA
jgi:hypothetical protein